MAPLSEVKKMWITRRGSPFVLDFLPEAVLPVMFISILHLMGVETENSPKHLGFFDNRARRGDGFHYNRTISSYEGQSSSYNRKCSTSKLTQREVSLGYRLDRKRAN